MKLSSFFEAVLGVSPVSRIELPQATRLQAEVLLELARVWCPTLAWTVEIERGVWYLVFMRTSPERRTS